MASKIDLSTEFSETWHVPQLMGKRGKFIFFFSSHDCPILMRGLDTPCTRTSLHLTGPLSWSGNIQVYRVYK